MKTRHGILALLAAVSFGLAAPRHLGAQDAGRGLVVWLDPGAVEQLDFAHGPGGPSMVPKPPFTFVEELKTGANPKVKVKDAAGRPWAVKWGREAHAEVLASRLAWAAGFYATTCYYLPAGTIEGAHRLERAGRYIGKNGEFTGAGFQLWDDGLLKSSWAWNDNPFVSTVPGGRELNGLKVLMMLTSNWDVKDARDLARGSNNGVHEEQRAEGRRYHFFVFDWGSSFGRWGGFATHSKWDCKGYAAQTPAFVRGIRDGKIDWGYAAAQYTGDIKDRITVADVMWLMQFLGRVSDEQLRIGAQAAGAAPEEIACFTSAIRARIEQLKRIASPSVTELDR